MHFKLIVAIVDDRRTTDVIEAARKAGATGATVISDARGQGLHPQKTFLGLTVNAARDVVFVLAEEHLARGILEAIAEAGEFCTRRRTGVAFQVDVEDAIGLERQIDALLPEVEEEL